MLLTAALILLKIVTIRSLCFAFGSKFSVHEIVNTHCETPCKNPSSHQIGLGKLDVEA